MAAASREEFLKRMREGRARGAAERAAGLRPPRKNARGPAGRRLPAVPRPPTAPPAPLGDTAEFKAAVAEAVTAALPQIVAKIAAASPQGSSDPGDWVERLAMSIAELTDQNGVGPKRIPPEIILARDKAHDRMLALIDEAAAAGEVPTYRLVAKTQLPVDGMGADVIQPLERGADNRVYPTVIGWCRIPNLAMEGENDWGKRISEAFRESIGNHTATAFARPRVDPPSDGVVRGSALSPLGNVVSGSAAATVRMHDPSQRNEGGAYMAMPAGHSASIVQNRGGPPTVKVRVLGTLAEPAIQNG